MTRDLREVVAVLLANVRHKQLGIDLNGLDEYTEQGKLAALEEADTAIAEIWSRAMERAAKIAHDEGSHRIAEAIRAEGAPK